MIKIAMYCKLRPPDDVYLSLSVLIRTPIPKVEVGQRKVFLYRVRIARNADRLH